jgi:hypothetical protein
MDVDTKTQPIDSVLYGNLCSVEYRVSNKDFSTESNPHSFSKYPEDTGCALWRFW